MKRLLLSVLFVTLFSGCQLGYLMHISYNHLGMLTSTENIDDVLKSDKLTEEQKSKIRLTQEAKQFAYDKLGLKRSNNYSKFVDLKRRYVTYNVTASEKWKFEPYLWSFPIIGKAPYKGFYNEDMAKEEAAEMQKKDYDTNIRGVSAYSTLGYMTDPLLSSMLNYSDYNLANTIIHELTHTTLFIKNNINFNERLAVFVANKGTEMFYLQREGSDSPTLKQVRLENEDDKLFSVFITGEIDSLKKWYADFDHSKNLPATEKETLRQERLNQISVNFDKLLKPKLKSKSYDHIFSHKLNNADLIDYNTYMKSLDVFETVYRKTGSNIPAFLDKCKDLNNVDDAEKELQKWADEMPEPQS